MKVDKEKIPQDLIDSLGDFKEFFEELKIPYWLGGGLLQKIYEGNYSEIKGSWEDNKHDIDFYCMQEDKNNIEKSDSLIQEGYQKISHFYHKTAYQKNGKSFEIVYFHCSDCDPNIIYYLSHGKKELWKTITDGLSNPKRCRMHHHDFPKEILETEGLDIGGIKLPSLNELYVKLSYPKLSEVK